MGIIGGWKEPWSGECLQCGDALPEPDAEGDRRCPRCRLTYKAAVVTVETIGDKPAGNTKPPGT